MKTKQCQLSQAITKEDVQAVLKSERRHAVEFEVLCLDGNKEEPVYLAPLKDPLAERQAIPIYRLPAHEYHEPIKVKPRSKRGQSKRIWQ